MEDSKVNFEEVKKEIEKMDLRNTLVDYMKEWKEFAKPVLMEYAAQKQEVNKEAGKFPVAADMKSKSAEARMENAKNRIKWSAEAGYKDVTLEEALVDAAVLTELSKGEFRVTPEQYVVQYEVKRRYRVQWE